MSSKTSFKLIANLIGHTDYVRALAIVPSNENIVSGSDDRTIKQRERSIITMY